MKTIMILVFVMLTTVSAIAQNDFNKWAVSGEFGVHSASDESALVTENFNHYGLDIRYNLNSLFGVGLYGGFDNFQFETLDGDYVKLDYGRVNLEASVNVFEILKLRHKRINVLLHGGPGVSFTGTDFVRSLSELDDFQFENEVDNRMFNVSGGITALVKLTPRVAFKMDYTSTIHLAQDRTLDGAFDITNAGVNSVVDNLSAGLVVYFGKKNKDGTKNRKEHADWYVAPVVVPVVNNITNVTEEVVRTIIQECNCYIIEYVYFRHDKSDVLQSERNSLTQIVTYMNKYPDVKLNLNGYASPTKGQDEYNLKLSQRRVDAVEAKLNLMGIPSSRIVKFAGGKDFNYIDRGIQEMGRRVEMIVE